MGREVVLWLSFSVELKNKFVRHKKFTCVNFLEKVALIIWEGVLFQSLKIFNNVLLLNAIR